MKKKTLVVDIDGVLTNETKGHDYKKRTPNLIVIKLINLLSKDYKIILHTARYLEDEKITKEWLEKYNVKYDDLILGKPDCNYLIDDKAL